MDYYDQITYSAQKAQGLPQTISPYFTNRFFDNSKTFVILFIFGILVVVLMVLIEFLLFVCRRKNSKVGIIAENIKEDKKKGVKKQVSKGDSENGSNKENYSEIIFKTLRDQKFKKCSISATKQYFLCNFFIRIYQITMTKLTFVCLLVIINRNLATSNFLDLIIAYIVLIVWLILFPIVMFVYMRNHAIDLMSPGMIVKFGASYLTYRGISKDVFAFLLQLKFSLLPIICVTLCNYAELQMISLVILYFFNILFITIYMPFFKVSKVFTEAISEGILMGFFIIILITYLIPSLNTSPIPRYLTFFMILLLLLIRTYRIVHDIIFRMKNLSKIKPTLVYGIDIPYEVRGEDHFEYEKKKNREKKLSKYNQYERRFRRDASSFDLRKSRNNITKVSVNSAGLNEKTNLNFSNDISQISRRKLLTGSNDRDESDLNIERRNSDSQISEAKQEAAHDPRDSIYSSEENEDSGEIEDQENSVQEKSKNINRKNSNSINDITNLNQLYKKSHISNPSSHTKITNNSGNKLNKQIPIYSQDVQFRENDAEDKKFFHPYKEINKEKIDPNFYKIKSLNDRNNFNANTMLNISKEITPINGDKTEDMILVSYLNGSRISNSKSIQDTKELERKYDEDFANISDNFKKNIILPDMSRIENDTSNNKKSFDAVSKISKTLSYKDKKSIVQSNPKIFKKNRKLYEIKEENTKCNNADYSERDQEDI